jgi:hypothetical protein
MPNLLIELTGLSVGRSAYHGAGQPITGIIHPSRATVNEKRPGQGHWVIGSFPAEQVRQAHPPQHRPASLSAAARSRMAADSGDPSCAH